MSELIESPSEPGYVVVQRHDLPPALASDPLAALNTIDMIPTRINTRDGVAIAWKEAPFAQAVHCEIRREGSTIAEIVESIPSLPRRFSRDGVVMVGDEEVPRHMWRFVRPKVQTGVTIDVSLHLAPMGGKNKSTLALIGTIAIMALALFVSGGSAGLLGPAFAAGTWGAKIAALAVTIGGTLLMRALTPPPSTPVLENSDRTFAPAGVQGNALKPGASVPRVVGTRKVYPPFATQPLVEIVGNKEIIEAVYVLAGPHSLTDIKLGEVLASSLTDVTIQSSAGAYGSTPATALTLVNRQGFTEDTNLELSAHLVQTDTPQLLTDQSTPTNSTPKWHRLTSGRSCNSFWIVVAFPEAIVTESDANTKRNVPIRIRMRAVGTSTWTYLPEIHFSNRYPTPFKKTIKLNFSAAPGSPVCATTNEAPIYAFKYVPAANAGNAPYASAYFADSYFNAASGGDVLATSTVGSTNVRNVDLYDDRVEIWLNPSTFSATQYEYEIMRGVAYKDSAFNISNYQHNDSESGGYTNKILDFFGWIISGGQYYSPVDSGRKVHSRCVVERVSSVWNTAPIGSGADNCAQIQVKITGRQLGPLSVLASGYVPDWNGSAWANWTTTSNPAPHLRDVFAGTLNKTPLPASLVDDANLVTFRTRCASKSYTVNAVIEGKSARVAADLIAACGYARVRQAETFGVVMDYDRSAESPVQIFTPRNSRGFKYDKPFVDFPSGFRVIFNNSSKDYREDELLVLDPSGDGGSRFEEMRYDGFVASADAQARALFDLKQLRVRSSIYTFTSDAQAIRCTRGDLIGIQHDVLQTQAGFSYITGLIEDGGTGQILGVTVDGTVPTGGDAAGFFTGPDGFLSTISDGSFFSAARYGIAMQRSTGVRDTREINQSATDEPSSIYFTTPLAGPATTLANGERIYDGLTRGVMIATGPLGSEFRRMIVTAILPKSGAGKPHDIVAVAEAPTLWS